MNYLVNLILGITISGAGIIIAVTQIKKIINKQIGPLGAVYQLLMVGAFLIILGFFIIDR
jgi:hypothetical protein